MDIHSFLGGARSSKSADVSSSSGDGVNSNQSDTECLEPSPAKKRLTVREKCRSKYSPVTSNQKYKKWEKSFTLLTYDNKEHSVRFAGRRDQMSLHRTGGTWISKPWKKLIKKMKTHAKSDNHI